MCEYDSKLLKLVVDDTPKAIFGLIIVSMIFLWTYVDYIPLEYLLLWSFLQIVFIGIRYKNAKIISKYIKENNSEKLKLHTLFFSVAMVYSGIVWTSGTLLGIIFAPSPYEFVGFAMIMGIIAAAVLSLTPIFNVFIVYFFIMILSQFFIMIYFGTHAHLAIAIFLFIYMPVVVMLSKSMFNNHMASINSHGLLESHVDELKELSITDSLTKIYNRRHFFEAAKTLISISKRDETEVSFLMIDVDLFKMVNDTYGHTVGDYVLVKLSQEIKSIVRQSDIFARLGGEEFGLLLHNTSLQSAKIIAEKIRSLVEKIDFENNELSIDVTVSIGCASIDNKISTLEELYHEADKQLYKAKELGRNRVQ